MRGNLELSNQRACAMPGSTELIIVLVVVLLLFGAGRLPKLARSLGQSSKEFKQGLSEGAPDDDDTTAK